MKYKYSWRLVLLAFLFWQIFIAIIYIIFPPQIPHKIHCENKQHKQLLERLDSIEMCCADTKEPKCYFDDNTWYWYTNIPCPKDLISNKE